MKIVKALESPEFQGLFTQFGNNSFRLETLQEYAVSYEDKPFKDFLAGKKRYTDDNHAGYLEMVSKNVRSGKAMSRVHVVKLPLSDYLRFEILWPYHDNVAAGEEINLIPVNNFDWPDGIPHFDFWLFDNKIAAIMRYDEQFGFTQAEITDEKATVEKCVGWKELALAQSVKYKDFVRSVK